MVQLKWEIKFQRMFERVMFLPLNGRHSCKCIEIFRNYPAILNLLSKHLNASELLSMSFGFFVILLHRLLETKRLPSKEW